MSFIRSLLSLASRGSQALLPEFFRNLRQKVRDIFFRNLGDEFDRRERGKRNRKILKCLIFLFLAIAIGWIIYSFFSK